MSYLVLNGNESLLLVELLVSVLLNVGEVPSEAALSEAVSGSVSAWRSLDSGLRLALESLEMLSCVGACGRVETHEGLVLHVGACDSRWKLILLVQVRLLVVALFWISQTQVLPIDT